MTQLAVVALLLHVCTTAALAGVSWFLQVVHYPLFARVGRRRFSRYGAAHRLVHPLVLWPLMVVELITALALAASAQSIIRPELQAAGLVLLACVWGLTIRIQRSPAKALETAFYPAALRSLLRLHCFRTTCWNLRVVVVVLMLAVILA